MKTILKNFEFFLSSTYKKQISVDFIFNVVRLPIYFPAGIIEKLNTCTMHTLKFELKNPGKIFIGILGEGYVGIVGRTWYLSLHFTSINI